MLHSIYNFIDTCSAWLFWGGLACTMTVITILTTVAVRGMIKIGRALAAQEEASENEDEIWPE